uniref:Uncharacterized protein n=1 Tax=Amphimedon queenslandica TaxID=400682 RepID=A0A1X7T5E4_AMPQE
MEFHRYSLFVLLFVLLFVKLQAIQGYGNGVPPDDSGGGSFQDDAGSDGVEHILATILPLLRDNGYLPAQCAIILLKLFHYDTLNISF